MDHHVDGEITGSLSYALENCLSKCKHMLQDDSLVEHYENLYQNNLFTYNKILALIKRSLEDCYTNHRCIKNAIENDTGIKIGMHHENENIVKKSLLTKEKVAQLICKKETMAHELEKNIQRDAELDRSLEQSSQEGIRAQTQLKLACFAKNRMKSSVELIEKTINDLENSCENTQTLVVTRQDEINHIIDEMNCINQTNIKEIEHIKRIHEEMDEELRQLGFQHHTTVQKLEETQDIISNIKKSKEEAQSALGKIENEIDNREQCISELKQEIASIENEKAMLKAEIENINCENERLKDVKLYISSEVNKIQEKIKSYEMDIRNNKSKIKLHKRGIKELEVILTSKHKEIITIYNTKAEQYRRYNVMRMQLEDAITNFHVNTMGHMEALKEYNSFSEKQCSKNIDPEHIRQLESTLQRQWEMVQSKHYSTTDVLDKAKEELSLLKDYHSMLTKDLEIAEKSCESLRRANSDLKEQKDVIITKDVERKNMITDLLAEQAYIEQKIIELKTHEEQLESEYNKQIEEETKNHRNKMTSLKNDDCIDMVEMMEEEQKNSQILLNAALESLEIEHTKSKSTIESQHNDLLKEEKGKYDAIRKVNHSEIESLKALIRECKAKDNIQPSNTSASANSFRRILPTDSNANAKSNGNSVQFKTPTYITETTTGSDMKSSAMELLKKVPRRKCIRRTASTADKVEAPKDELDLFC